MTKASRLFANASFDPSALKMIGEAFDEAWASIGNSIGSDPVSVDAARTRLANIMLGLAKDRQISSERLKETALRLFRTG